MSVRLGALVLLGLAAWSTPHSRQALSLEEIRKGAAARIAAHVQSLKDMPENPLFARTASPLQDQNNLAAARVETIKKLLEAGGSDAPDYGRILGLTIEILSKAPDTPQARKAHWDLHRYYRIVGIPQADRDALATYLVKYKAGESEKKEAFGALAALAADEREWDAVLYYAEEYLALDPGSYPRLLDKARALVNLGFLDDGKALLRRIVGEDSGSAQAALAASALAELEAAAFDPGLVTGYKKTMEIMRQIGTAAASYWAEYAKFPPSIKDLYPDFLRELTERDAWGNPFLIKSDPDSEQFMIASPGSDGKFDGFHQTGSYVDMPGKDIIFADGSFVFSPRIRRP